MQPLAKAALLLAAIFALLALAVYFFKTYRSGSDGDGSTASELLEQFRELHGKGELSDAEFRTIKKKLSAQLQAELRNNEGKG